MPPKKSTPIPDDEEKHNSSDEESIDDKSSKDDDISEDDENECAVCVLKYNNSTRKNCQCPHCNFEVCRHCIQKYVLSTILEPHCMGCKKVWCPEVNDVIFTRTFFSHEYRIHKENLLIDREKSLIPATMDDANKQERIYELDKKYKTFHDEIVKIREPMDKQIDKIKKDAEKAILKIQAKHQPAIDAIKKKQDELNKERNTILNITAAAEKKSIFIWPCPGENCRGFLNEEWICKLCKVKVCPSCLEIKWSVELRDKKVTEKDLETEKYKTLKIGTIVQKWCKENKDDEHECDEDKIASVKLIKQDTKACPKCGTRIHKTEGCNTMFCTQCNTLFDYRTGDVTTENHNPHYYEWMRRNGNDPTVQARANHNNHNCEGLPEAYHANGRMENNLHVDQRLRNTLLQIHNFINHLTGEYNGLLTRIRPVDLARYNQSIRIEYILKRINEKELKRLIFLAERKREKQKAIYDILNTFGQVGIDLWRGYMDIPRHVLSANDKAEKELLKNLEEIRDFTNKALVIICKRYNVTKKHITNDWNLRGIR